MCNNHTHHLASHPTSPDNIHLQSSGIPIDAQQLKSYNIQCPLKYSNSFLLSPYFFLQHVFFPCNFSTQILPPKLSTSHNMYSSSKFLHPISLFLLLFVLGSPEAGTRVLQTAARDLRLYWRAHGEIGTALASAKARRWWRSVDRTPKRRLATLFIALRLLCPRLHFQRLFYQDFRIKTKAQNKKRKTICMNSITLVARTTV